MNIGNLIAGGDGTCRIVNVYSGLDLEDNAVVSTETA